VIDVFLDCVLNSPQWLQLLRPFSDEERECDFAVHYRHMPDAFHMDCFFGLGMGVVQVATDCWLWSLGIFDVRI
jgi:hypothetical protein